MRRFGKGFVFAFLISTLFQSLGYTATWSKPQWSSDSHPGHRSATRFDNSSGEVSPFNPGSHNFAVDLGQVFLMGDLTKDYTDSIGSQFHYTYGVSDLFGFDTSLGYSEHGEGKFSMVSLLTGMRMNLSWYDRVVPYLNFGLGFYRPSYQDPTAPAPSGPNAGPPATLSTVLFGVHLGPGIDLALSKNIFFGAALTFHNMFGANKTMSDGSTFYLGGSYTSFFLHLGATF